ncbi:MFS transporter [Stenotrophomonas sp. SY1]|jgi:sugar phosphate permease|uniref:MFS transporter n=1 Tax=Stenotrophomonas sp. SY1 TaxID=477235 RepID=UPI001E3CAA90|nr:MFS transporter [Stenotrophomonas sp. SY1]MCD9088618.1 MFS transporter [Stenotrophomonas sp. SY1]
MKRYYPWLMAVMGMLVLLVSNGLTVTGLTAFDESLLKEFGWTRSELKLRDLITLVLAGWMAPFLGALIDKVGPRKLILAGIALLAALYFAYAHVHSLTHLYLIHVGFAAVLVAAGLNVAVIFVSQWFATHRGTAIGIALVGTSLGGMLFPKLGVHLMQSMDWRAALIWETAIPVAFLVIAFLFARSPRPGGIQPWGADTLAAKAQAGKPAASSLPDMSYNTALRTRTFWVLAFVAMTTFFSIMAVASNLFLHMRDLGFDPATAGNGLGLMFGLAMVGKFLFGFLADVLPAKRVFLVNLAIMAAGAVILATMRADLIWYSLALFGLGWGGLYTMIQLLAVNAFGLSAAGKILGTITLLDATTAGLGIWVTAKIFDVTKSYHIAFSLICGLILLALLAATLVRDERARLAKP